MNENYVREKNCPLEAFDVNVWGQVAGRQTTQRPHSSTGFVSDCHCEEAVNKSYYLENSSVKQVPQGYGLQQELELELLQQLPLEQLRQLLSPPSGHQIGVA